MPYYPDIAARKMHQTTVRFGADLWEALEAECGRLGVSVAQYLREAALARLVYAALRRGDDEFEFAVELATGQRAGRALGHGERERQGRKFSVVDAEEQAWPEGSEEALAAEERLSHQGARKRR